MRIGVFGAGSVGQRHLTNLRQLSNAFDLTVYDPAVLGSVPTADDLWRTKPEVVFICTPPSTHFQLVTNALHNGCHVFCEKPLASEPWQADTLNGLARKLNRVLAIGYNLRWQLDAFRRAASGSVVRFVYAGDMRTWPSLYTKDALEECSHEIDAAIYVNGPVEKVLARQGEVWTWSIQLQHFTATSEILLDTAAQEGDWERGATTPYARWTFAPALNEQAYRDEIAAFLRACEKGEWDARLCTGMQAAHVCHIIDACRKSANEFRIVRL
jgi:predicted dehydrogenase